VPADILQNWRAAGQRGKSARKAWEERLAALPVERRGEFARRINGDLPLGLLRRGARLQAGTRQDRRKKSRPASPRRTRSKR